MLRKLCSESNTGVKRWVSIISNILHRSINYEPPWRYYYIIRNSTRLLLEGWNKLCSLHVAIDQLGTL